VTSPTPRRGELRRLRREVWGEQPFRAYSRTRRRKWRWSSIALVAVGALVGVTAIGLIAKAGSPGPTPEHRVTLCHRTDSHQDPYVELTIDASDVTHYRYDQHNGPIFFASIPKDETWGDIIPPFDFGPGRSYGGMNWPSGQPILANGCKLTGPHATAGAGSR
jgi:hypothetical protein